MAQARALITGAGSGLGRALAERYAQAGYAVACADIKLERAQETARSLGGAPHLALPVDVGDDASFTALNAALARQWDTLDLVINNAGVASGGSLLEADMSEWQWMLNINLLGVVRGCREFTPWLVKQGHGRIINVASFAGLAGAPNIMTYGVAKAGVVMLSEQLRAELHPKGVKVSVVCPSFFKTNLPENWRGSDRMKAFATTLMDRARESAADIAAAVFAQAERDTFLILPTAAERLRWRLKRFVPRIYFKQLLKLGAVRGAAMTAPAADSKR
jgi:NADP-dependent 3-hydroxy acid dehydrogenase YdfG